MTITHHARGELLGKALIMFVGLLLVSLLIIFAIEPSIYTTTLWPGWVPTERYPWPVLLFLGALIAFLGMLMYGVLHHWRWLFWLSPSRGPSCARRPLLRPKDWPVAEWRFSSTRAPA